MSEPVVDKLITLARHTTGFDQEQIKPEVTFADIGFDSLDEVEFLMDVEEEFNVEIPDEDADNIKTINNLVEYLEKEHGIS